MNLLFVESHSPHLQLNDSVEPGIEDWVDAVDYTVWRDSLGGDTLVNRDGTLAGPIGQADYDAWKANFGQTVGGGGAFALAVAVPEPASTFSAIVAAAFGLFLGRPFRRS